MRRNRIGRIALAVFAAGVIAGCRNGMEEVVPPENAPSQASMSSRETARIAEALRDDAPNPLLVERKFREMARAMQDGTLDFSRGEFFSGMTDEALQRQAMLTWNLAPVFGKMEDGSRVAVVVGDGQPGAGRIVRQALVERKADLITRNPALGIENSHISHRMDTRIRPARPDDLDILF